MRKHGFQLVLGAPLVGNLVPVLRDLHGVIGQPGGRVVGCKVGGRPNHVLEIDPAEVDAPKVEGCHREEQDHRENEGELDEALTS